MKKILVFILTLTLALTIPASAAPRDTEWGLTISEVKSIEEADEKSSLEEQKEETLYYRVEEYEIDWLLGYYFEEDELRRAQYASLSDEIARTGEFGQMELLLAMRYEETDHEEKDWHPSGARFQYDLDSWEDYQFAFLNGHLSWITIRETETSQIGNWISTEDGVDYRLVYIDKEHLDILRTAPDSGF